MRIVDRLSSLVVSRTSPMAPIFAKYSWSIPLVTVSGLIVSLLEGFSIGLVIPLLATLSLSPNAEQQEGIVGLLYSLPAIFPEDYRLFAIAGLILTATIVKGILQAVTELPVNYIDGKANQDIRDAMANQLLRSGYPFFLAHDQMRILNAISTDSWRASEAMHAIFGIVSSVVNVIVFGILLIAVNWQLFILTLVGSIAIRLVQSTTTKRIKAMSETVRVANIKLGERMVMLAFDLVKVVRLFNQQDKERERFGAASEEVRRSMTELADFSIWFGPIFETMFTILILTVMIVGFYSGMNVPVLMTFLLLLYRVQPHISSLAEADVAIASVAASVKEVEWLIKPDDKQDEPPGHIPFNKLEREIRFDNVSFDYTTRRSGTPAVGPVSFSIRAGEWTALIAPSGAGKSTIINMIGRLLHPTEGKITVDGVDLADLDLISWRNSIGIAGQDVELFAGTIADNLRFGAPDATEEDMIEAAKMAEIHEFIIDEPEGYTMLVGDEGMALSGGQRQRIGIARALIRKPQLIILDEATNAVDEWTESEIIRHISEMPHKPTVLVVSHRASTISTCKHRIELEEPEIPGDWDDLETNEQEG